MRTKESVFQFFGDPEGADEKIDQALEERGLVALDAVAHEEQNPSDDEQRKADAPVRERCKYDSGENDWNTDTMQDLVPCIRVLVVVLRHVLVKGGHVLAALYTPDPAGDASGLFVSAHAKGLRSEEARKSLCRIARAKARNV
jgi:hypothetical protein